MRAKETPRAAAGAAREQDRASPAWMRNTALTVAAAAMIAAGIGAAILMAGPPAKVPMALYITDAPGEIEALEVTVASVTAGPDRLPLEVAADAFDLAALRGPEGAILLAWGDVPPDALDQVEVTFSSARATMDGQTFDVPLERTLRVEGIASDLPSPAFLLDVDVPSSLAVDGDDRLVFRPVAAVMASAHRGAAAAPPAPGDWMPVEAAPQPAAGGDLRPAGLVLAPRDDAAGRPAGMLNGTPPTDGTPLADGASAADGAPLGDAASAMDGTAGPVLNDAVVVDGEVPAWLVLFADPRGEGDMQSIITQAGGVLVTSLSSMPVAHVVATREQAEALAGDPRIERVEAAVPIHYDDAASRAAIRAPELTAAATALHDPAGHPIDGRGIGVAVVDSGIDGTHPAFRSALGDSILGDNRKVVSQAFVPLDNTDTSSGHGTHVAGIVAGRDDVSQGAAPGAALYGLGIGEASTTVWSAQAFDWILRHHDEVDPPIRVVTNSWSAGTTYDPGSVTTRMVQRMVDAGIVVVFSAGNLGGDGSSAVTSAQCRIPTPGVVCVAAYDDEGTGTRDGVIAPYSSRGAVDDPATWPDVSAPGTRIASARPLVGTTTGIATSWHVELSGTSQAAPHAAGVAALMLQANGSLSPADVEAILKASAYPFADGGAFASGHHAKGHGLVDAYAAVSRSL